MAEDSFQKIVSVLYMKWYTLICCHDMQCQNLDLLTLVTLSSKIHLVENIFQMVATFQCRLPLVVAKGVFGFALGVKPIWWYHDLRSREEKIVQLQNLASKYVYVQQVAVRNHHVPIMCSIKGLI